MGSLGASLLIAELTLRARDWCKTAPPTESQDHDSIFEFSPTRHHRLVPNAKIRHKELEYDYIWANNSLGMRDRERPLKKDPNSFRILFLGDSMVQGYGVAREQSMVARLEASLNEPKREKTVEVLNGGVFGYSPFLEHLYLREVGPIVEPDMVIVGFFLGNDVGDDWFYARQAQVKESGEIFFTDRRWPWSDLSALLGSTASGTVGKTPVNTSSLVSKKYTAKVSRNLKSLLVKSRLVRLIKEVRETQRERSEYAKRREREDTLTQRYRNDIRINLGLINYPVLDRERRLAYWQLSEGCLRDVSRLCKERGMVLVLVVIPGGGPSDFTEPYKILDQFGQDVSVPVIHLLPGFLNNPYKNTSYSLDGHWNPEGNRLAATVIDRELRRLNLLPPVSCADARRVELIDRSIQRSEPTGNALASCLRFP
jgi:hypothetical protein